MLQPHLMTLSLKRYADLRKTGDTKRLCEQLCNLPCPEEVRVGLTNLPVPKTLQEFRSKLCWGQRLFMAMPHNDDLETVLYFFCSYFAPIYFKEPYSDALATRMFWKVKTSHVTEVYPVMNRLVGFFEELILIERDRLDCPPDKTMLAAGIDKLKPYTDWSVIELIAEKARLVDIERNVMQVSYDTAITILGNEKEKAEFQKRYMKILGDMNRAKNRVK